MSDIELKGNSVNTWQLLQALRFCLRSRCGSLTARLGLNPGDSSPVGESGSSEVYTIEQTGVASFLVYYS